MVAATLRKILGRPMQKQSDDSCLKEDQEPCTICTVLYPIDLYPIKLMLRGFKNCNFM